MKKSLLLVMVAGVLFACNKQDTADAEDSSATGDGSVTLSIKQEALSRGISDQKGDTEYAIISSGKIYFLNASNANVYQRELTTDEIDDLKNTTTTPGGNSITITGVPNTATTLYFLANIKTTAGPTFPMVEGVGSAEARLRIDKLQGDAKYVPMAGLSSTFVPDTGTNKTTSVTLTPLVARIELGRVTVQNQDGAGQPAVSSDITDYKLSGVFINNVRQYVLLSGMPYLVGSPIDIKAQAGWTTGWTNYFSPTNTTFPYYLGGSPAAPADWVANAMVNYCSPTNSGITFYPDMANGATNTDLAVTSKHAWAYQVCPSTTVPVGSGLEPDVPHIILKLTDVTYNVPELTNSVQYVTVTKYKDADTSAPITEFKRGHVYRITNLTFTHNEATDEPYQKDIIVTATVSVAPWVINNIVPDWN